MALKLVAFNKEKQEQDVLGTVKVQQKLLLFFFFLQKTKKQINEWFVILLNVSRDEGPCEFSVLAETSCKCSAFYAAANEPSSSDLPRNQIKYTCIS